MINPLGHIPSKGNQGTTRGKEKIVWPRWESNPPPPDWIYRCSAELCTYHRPSPGGTPGKYKFLWGLLGGFEQSFYPAGGEMREVGFPEARGKQGTS